MGGMPQLVKLKAHSEVAEGMSLEEQRHVKGNELADFWAKAGARLNNCNDLDEKRVEVDQKAWKRIAKLMVKTLKLWPPSRELWGKLEREVQPRSSGSRRRLAQGPQLGLGWKVVAVQELPLCQQKALCGGPRTQALCASGGHPEEACALPGAQR